MFQILGNVTTVVRLFDQSNSGYVPVTMFRQILKTKHVSESDINEMIEGKSNFLYSNDLSNLMPSEYKRLNPDEASTGEVKNIDYNKFIKMLGL